MSAPATTGTSRLIETSFGKLHIWDTPVSAGGPAVVFLQGLLAGPDVWSDVLGSLAARRRCITVDWPFGAHSMPMKPDADLSPPGQARLVVEVLDRLGLEQAVLVGNDSGGVISQLVVASAPQRVCGLVLIACDAFEVFPPAAYRALFALAGVPGFMALVGRMLSRPSFARSRLGYGPVIANHPDSVAHWAHPLASDPLIRRDLVKLMRGSSNTQTLAAANRFPGYERPVLVVWAQQDQLFPQTLGERLARAFPHGKLAIVENSRTFVPRDQPARLAALIDDYLESLQA